MNRISPLLKVSTKFGILAGLLGSALVIALYYIGRHPFLFPIYFDFRIILFAVFMFFSLKEYRDFQQGGILYFWEDILGCFALVTVFAFLSSLIIYVFGTFEKEFVTSFIKLFTTQVRNYPTEIIEQIGKENLERNLRDLSATDSFAMARNYFTQSYFISFFITIILSVVLRKSN